MRRLSLLTLVLAAMSAGFALFAQQEVPTLFIHTVLDNGSGLPPEQVSALGSLLKAGLVKDLSKRYRLIGDMYVADDLEKSGKKDSYHCGTEQCLDDVLQASLCDMMVYGVIAPEGKGGYALTVGVMRREPGATSGFPVTRLTGVLAAKTMADDAALHKAVAKQAGRIVKVLLSGSWGDPLARYEKIMQFYLQGHKGKKLENPAGEYDDALALKSIVVGFKEAQLDGATVKILKGVEPTGSVVWPSDDMPLVYIPADSYLYDDTRYLDEMVNNEITVYLASVEMTEEGGLRCAVRDIEPADDAGEIIRPLPPKGMVKGNFYGLDKTVLWYRLEAAKAKNKTITLRHENGRDFDIYIYDEDKTNPQRKAESAELCETLVVPPLKGAMCYVKIANYSGKGPFTLTVADYVTDGHPPWIKGGVVKGKFLSEKKEMHWYKIKVKDINNKTVELAHDQGQDFDIAVYDQGGFNKIAAAQTDSNPEIISFQGKSLPGKVLLMEVRNYKGFGSYTITIK